MGKSVGTVHNSDGSITILYQSVPKFQKIPPKPVAIDKKINYTAVRYPTLKDHTKDKPAVTTMIITYNHINYIEQAIKSVLNQKCKYKHIIFISDDCSTDGTSDICRKYKNKYPDRIKLNVNKKNMGVVEHFNKMFSQIKTKYTAYLEGDDFWCDNSRLEKQITKLEENPSCVFCCGNTSKQVVMRPVNFKPSETDHRFIPKTLESGIYNIQNFNRISHPSARVFRTHIVRENLQNLDVYADPYLQALMLFLGDVYYFKDFFSIYNWTRTGNWTKLTSSNHADAFKNIIKYMKDRFGYDHK